jgi:hypothetical protein
VAGYWRAMSEDPAAALRPSERDALDRLVARFPALATLIFGGLRRMPPGSPLRRRLLSPLVARAFAAMARSDVEVVLLSYEADAEVWMRGMSGVGISDCYRGYEGIRALYADLDEAFADWRWTVRALADGGDRLAVRADFVGYGRGSGAKTTVSDGGTAVRLSGRGLVLWQKWFVEQSGWKQALDAVELRDQTASAETAPQEAGHRTARRHHSGRQ